MRCNIGSKHYCQLCGIEINRYDFPSRGNICYECEIEYSFPISKKGKPVVKNKDVYRAARGSGYFPLTFNFVLTRDGKYIQCSYCGIFVYYRKITRDHIYPKSLGGLLKAPACESCNIAKENRLPIEWAIHSANRNLDIATIPIGAEYMQTEVEETRDTLYAEIAQLFDNLIDEIEQGYAA